MFSTGADAAFWETRSMTLRKCRSCGEREHIKRHTFCGACGAELPQFKVDTVDPRHFLQLDISSGWGANVVLNPEFAEREREKEKELERLLPPELARALEAARGMMVSAETQETIQRFARQGNPRARAWLLQHDPHSTVDQWRPLLQTPLRSAALYQMALKVRHPRLQNPEFTQYKEFLYDSFETSPNDGALYMLLGLGPAIVPWGCWTPQRHCWVPEFVKLEMETALMTFHRLALKLPKLVRHLVISYICTAREDSIVEMPPAYPWNKVFYP